MFICGIGNNKVNIWVGTYLFKLTLVTQNGIVDFKFYFVHNSNAVLILSDLSF